jgi:hypothetical protein
LQHDAANAEDVDTDGEDHAPDETRYACMARPWVATKVVKKSFDFAHLKRRTFDDAHAEAERGRGKARV